MFAKIALAAALALSAGAANAQPQPAAPAVPGMFSGPMLELPPGAQLVPIPGTSQFRIMLPGAAPQNLSSGGTPRIVVDGSGSYRTVYDR